MGREGGSSSPSQSTSSGSSDELRIIRDEAENEDEDELDDDVDVFPPAAAVDPSPMAASNVSTIPPLFGSISISFPSSSCSPISPSSSPPSSSPITSSFPFPSPLSPPSFSEARAAIWVSMASRALRRPYTVCSNDSPSWTSPRGCAIPVLLLAFRRIRWAIRVIDCSDLPFVRDKGVEDDDVGCGSGGGGGGW